MTVTIKSSGKELLKYKIRLFLKPELCPCKSETSFIYSLCMLESTKLKLKLFVITFTRKHSLQKIPLKGTNTTNTREVQGQLLDTLIMVAQISSIKKHYG